MATYNYQGRDQKGAKVSGSLEANSEELVVEYMMNKGIIPTLVKEGKLHKKEVTFNSLFTPDVPLEVLVIFCRQLYSLTKAGVPLLRAIRGLIQNCQNKQLHSALEEVVSELSNGRSLSASMKLHPTIFSTLFVSMIHVGEDTGRLDEALLQLSGYYEQELATRKRIKEAVRYPIFVVAFITIALFVLNIFVIPKFVGMFSRFGTELPLPTQILIGTSNFFVNYWHFVLMAIIAIWFFFRHWKHTAKGHEAWDKFRLRMPLVGDVVNRAQLSRFSRTFALMLQAGIPLNQALALSAESLGNKYLELRLLEMKSDIEAGNTLSSIAAQSKIFTSLVIQMMSVGEETGRVDELLLEVADFYDREVDYDLKTLTARIEPILLLVVAGMVLVLALGIFLPMWGMIDVVKGS